MDHYAEAVYSERGQCWRFVYRPESAAEGQPMHCPEPVTHVGDHRLAGGKRIRVWSCEGHLEGVENLIRVHHR